ncbi:MAG: transcription factor S [Candidatus Woesearchaeota archaeon]
MQFCKKCGAIMLPKKEGSKTFFYCSSCKIKQEGAGVIIEKAKTEAKKIEVVDESNQEIHPIVDAECKKCGHKKAYFWEIQTRAGDEPATKFFKCEKCKHTWRDYK